MKNNRKDEDILEDFFELAKRKEWFNSPIDSEDFAEIKVDEVLFDDFNEYYKDHESDGIDYREIERDYQNEIMRGLV